MPFPVPDRRLSSLLLLGLLAGCMASSPGKPEGTTAERPVMPEEAPVPRPVIALERVNDEMEKAIALLKESKPREAEAHFEEIVKLRPDLVEAHFNLGWLRQQQGKCQEALPALAAGLALKPAEVRALNLKAICERTLGRFADAETTYRQALTLAPDDPALHYNLGILYELYLFRPDEALLHYRRFQSLQATPDPKVAGWVTVLERKEAK